MKKQILSVSVMLFLIINASGQSISLTFTAVDNDTHLQLDSIKVMNRTQGGDTVLFWPDTVLSLYVVGIEEPQANQSLFRVNQNYPNPVTDQTTISIFVPERDEVDVILTDMLGRVMLKDERLLDQGTHSFRFRPGEGKLYFFTAQWRGNCSSIKILCSSSCSEGIALLEYSGRDNSSPQLKVTEAVQDFSFTLGDTLLYIGYANTLQSGMLDAPEASETYTFQFATNIPCPGTPTVEYEGQVYNTIQIFSQCWLKENLNVGTMIQSIHEMTDNGIIEKWCYSNRPDSWSIYGGFYNWDEMMQYSTQAGIQGICPPGWHIPKDEEWKILAGSVDSWYGIGDTIWDPEGYLNHDAARNLKTTSGWYGSWNGTDIYGFSALPGGLKSTWDGFIHIGTSGSWFTSSEANLYQAWGFHFHGGPSSWFKYYKTQGFSVRCIKD